MPQPQHPTRVRPTAAVDTGASVPAALAGFARDAAADLRADHGEEAAALLATCLDRTWRTCLRRTAGDVFVVTGDLPAMWLRDAAAQLRPYLAVGWDPEVADVLVAVSRRTSRLVLTDPYANAFNDGPTDAHPDEHDDPPPSPSVWERKYELDSLAAHLSFGYEVWRATGRTEHLGDGFRRALAVALGVLEAEQEHEVASTYVFRRLRGPFAGDTLPRDGRGAPVGPTGMTWSGFRPSDDRCELGYLVPANAAAVVALEGVAELAARGLVPEDLGERAVRLATGIADGIVGHGIVDAGDGGYGGCPVYAYEVDGLGGAVLMDDANVPSLLSLPYLGWTTTLDPTYRRTRDRALGPTNPFWYKGSAGHGVGSPHTPTGHVWPIALAMEGLTSPDRASAAEVLDRLLAVWAGEPGMCESFHVDDPRVFTRDWFCWADSLVAEFALSLTAGHAVPRFLPDRLPGVAAAQQRAGLVPVTDRRTRW